MGDIATQLRPAGRFADELTELIAAAYASHEGVAERARALERAARAVGDTRHALLARLIVADLDNRAGRRAEGIREAHAVLGSTDDRVVVAHAHAVIAGGVWRLGDNTEALKHAYEADRLLVEGDPLCLRVDHANVFALQLNDQRVGAFSSDEYEAAQRLADRLGHPDLIVANLNNWAWCAHTHGDRATALDLVRRILDHAARLDHPLNTSCADTVASVLAADGQAAAAVRILEDALAQAPSTDTDAVPACLVTLAGIQLAEGDIAAAVRTLDRCRVITQRDQLPEMDAAALRLLATCHAQLGDFEAAYREMVDFHDAWTVRRSEQSEVLASVTHARYSVDEARRDSDHFRELSERDSLTGLWNRRRSDSLLAAMLEVAPDERPPVSVALLDLDHFKQVNDNFTHEVGDSVLRQVAVLLRTVVEPAGQAARHGGEEFLLILDGGPEMAAEVCERVRLTIAAHAWGEIAPGLHVTTSVGVTTLRPEDDVRSALARADGYLYGAKSAGRDRVVAD